MLCQSKKNYITKWQIEVNKLIEGKNYDQNNLFKIQKLLKQLEIIENWLYFEKDLQKRLNIKKKELLKLVDLIDKNNNLML